jgi:hypothetical protein
MKNIFLYFFFEKYRNKKGACLGPSSATNAVVRRKRPPGHQGPLPGALWSLRFNLLMVQDPNQNRTKPIISILTDRTAPN